MDKEQMSKVFRHFAEWECKDSSELYTLLSQSVAEDEEILRVAAYAPSGQPIPNLFFGAVQYLLLKGTGPELRRYYPGLVAQPMEAVSCYRYFREFVLEQEYEIVTIMRNKRVQTNEVRRCAYLYPVFCSVYDRVRKPLALVELGCSAGLQLLWDQYSYSYGNEARSYGRIGAKVHISSEIRGDHKPLLHSSSPPVIYRMGIDLHVNDMHNSDDFLWLRALIWPGEHNRISLLEHAVEVLKEQQELQFREGDGTLLLPEIVDDIPEEAVICVFHTHVANQIHEESKRNLMNHLKEIGRKRDIVHIYNNMWDGDLHVDFILGGLLTERTVARTDGHARWFEWLDRGTE